MLDLIVLGQIPGTSIQINYNDVIRITIAAIVVGGLLWELRRYKQQQMKSNQISPDQIAL